MCNWYKLFYILSLAISLSYANDGICIGKDNCLENDVGSGEYQNRYDEGSRNIILLSSIRMSYFFSSKTRYPPPKIKQNQTNMYGKSTKH